MDWMELLTQIFQLCIVPLIGVLTTFLVNYLRKKSTELQEKTDSELAKKYMQMLTDTICVCVIATNQTYVEALKKQGKFDKEAQEKAFQMTLDAVLAILSQEAQDYLTSIYGDLNAYITQLIEAQVNQCKQE